MPCDQHRPGEAKLKLAESFAGWSPKLLAMTHEAGDRFTVLPLYALPVGHRWVNQAGVTLLGDAAHVMSPFSGEGVNLAMIDAADLAVALADSEDWQSAVPGYESTMFERAEVAAARAAGAIASAFSDDGFEHSLRHMQGRHQSP